MAMMNEKDKPTYYNIVNTVTGEVLATASKSRAMACRNGYQKTIKDKLELVLIEEKDE